MEFKYHVWYEIGTTEAEWAQTQYYMETNNDAWRSGLVSPNVKPYTDVTHVMALYPADIPGPGGDVEVVPFVAYRKDTHPAEFDHVWKNFDYVEWGFDGDEIGSDFAGKVTAKGTHTIMAIPPLRDIPEPEDKPLEKAENTWYACGTPGADALKRQAVLAYGDCRTANRYYRICESWWVDMDGFHVRPLPKPPEEQEHRKDTHMEK